MPIRDYRLSGKKDDSKRMRLQYSTVPMVILEYDDCEKGIARGNRSIDGKEDLTHEL